MTTLWFSAALNRHHFGDPLPDSVEITGAALATFLANAAAAEAAAKIKADALSADVDTLRADGALKTLIRMTPAQIDAWCAANITDLASARNAIRLLARAVSVIARAQIDQ